MLLYIREDPVTCVTYNIDLDLVNLVFRSKFIKHDDTIRIRLPIFPVLTEADAFASDL